MTMQDVEIGKGQIYGLIPKVMKAIGAIGKDRQNQQQGYKFRGIDDVYNAIQGPFADHGLFVMPEVVEQKREERQTKSGGALTYTILTVRHTLFAPDGSRVTGVTIGEAMDSGDKSSNKAMSAAMKYFIFEVFSIATQEDNDTENNSPDPAPRQQQAPRQPPPRQPAKPAAKPTGDPDADEQFAIRLSEAFEAREFTKPAQKAACDSTCGKYNLANIRELPPEKRADMLKAIAAGKMDNFKEKGGK